MPLADRLQTVRLERMLTQKELAALAGVSASAVESAEEGRHMPNPSTIRKLSEVLGVQPIALVTPSEYVAARSRRKAPTLKGVQRAVNRQATQRARAERELAESAPAESA